MTNLDHIMPQPNVILILWGHDYIENPTTVQRIGQMVSDLVTGPFMNGMAQYGVQRGSVHQPPYLIDDQSPPSTIVWYDQNNNLQDDITKKLIEWITAGLVPPPTPLNDINQLYLIIPPPESLLETYNNSSDPIGKNIQSFHNEGRRDSLFLPLNYYWAIVKTNFANFGPTSGLDWVLQGLAIAVCHELAEQFVDRDGSYTEICDPCLKPSTYYLYRGWPVQPYLSVWDGNKCIHGDGPVSLKKFLTAIGFDWQNQGVRALGAPVINIDYIAVTMQSFET